MIWLPRTTDNSTYFAQSLEIRGIESRLYIVSVTFTKFLYMDMTIALKSLNEMQQTVSIRLPLYHTILQLYTLLTFKCITFNADISLDYGLPNDLHDMRFVDCIF